MTRGATRIAAVVACAALTCAGCRGDPPPALPGDDDAADDDGVAGRFGLVHLHDDGVRTAIHAVFARDLPGSGVIDGLAALGLADPGLGYWVPPAEPDVLVPVAELDSGWSYPGDRFYDAGDPLDAGPLEVPRGDAWLDGDGFVIDEVVAYAAEGPAALLDEGLELTWPGGDDLGAGGVPAREALDLPVLIGHPDGETRWVEGTDLSLEWEPAPRGEVLVTVLGDRGWYQARVPSADGLVLPADVLADAILDRAEIQVARTELEEIAVDPGRVAVRQTRARRLQVTYSGVLVPEPADLFWGDVATVTVTHLDGAFTAGETTFDLGDGVTVDGVTIPGGAGDTAELLVTVAAGAPTGPRDLTATVAGQPVVSERALRVWLPRTEHCDDAGSLPGTGTYHGDLAGMADDLSDPSACTGYAATGPDAVYAVTLPEYAIVAAHVWIPGADAVLYLLRDCDHAEEPVACADSGGLNVPEEMSHAPLPGHAGTYYLVIDTFEGLPDGTGSYVLDLEVIGY